MQRTKQYETIHKLKLEIDDAGGMMQLYLEKGKGNNAKSDEDVQVHQLKSFRVAKEHEM